MGDYAYYPIVYLLTGGFYSVSFVPETFVGEEIYFNNLTSSVGSVFLVDWESVVVYIGDSFYYSFGFIFFFSGDYYSTTFFSYY